MSSRRIERVIKSEPVNATAARVMKGGAVYDPELKPWDHVYDTPPPTREVPSDCPDLTGTLCGRMVVVGLSAVTRRASGRRRTAAAWVLRCACGRYTLRSKRGVLSACSEEQCCPRCERERSVRQKYDRMGARDFTKPD